MSAASTETVPGLQVCKIDCEADRMLAEGRIRALLRMLAEVPADDFASWPRLQLANVWVTAFTRGGRPAMALLEALDADLIRHRTWRPQVLALRPLLLTMLDDFDEAYAEARQAIGQIDAAHPFPQRILRTTLAHLHVVKGEYSKARDLLDRTGADCDAASGAFMTIFAQCVDGVVDLLHGRLRQATARFRHSSLAGVRQGRVDTNANAMAGILLAEALYEQNELAEVEQLLEVHLPRMRELGFADHLICGYRNLARSAFHRGDVDRAVHAATEMEFLGHRLGLPRLIGSAQLERARLALWRGEVDEAREALHRARLATNWGEAMTGSLFGNDSDTLREGELRLQIHAGDAEAAANQLKVELERAERAGRRRRSLRLQTLLALALDRCGRERSALRILRDAMEFGARERFVRTFLDEGEAFAQLSSKLVSATSLEARSSGDETLTRRELEILALLAEGHSNRAIASRLFVSETTVRTHLRHINAKLQVHTRTQAIAVARQRKLIGN